MSTIDYRVLVARLLTPMQDCKICATLDINNPEDGKEDCRAGVFERIDAILCDAQDDRDAELNTAQKNEYDQFISKVIDFKKLCFECRGKAAILHGLYDEIRAKLDGAKKSVDGEKKIHSVKKSVW